MRSEDLQGQAARLIALYDTLRTTKPHEFRFHRLLHEYITAFAEARGEDDWFLYVDSRKFNPNWGRHMAIHAARRGTGWVATLKVNARSRADTLPALASRPPDAGLLTDSATWNDLLIGIINMALWHEGENGWWKVPDPKKGRIVLVAYAALAYRSDKQREEYAKKHGLPFPAPEDTIYVSDEEYERLREKPVDKWPVKGKHIVVSSKPSHRSLFPDRSWQSSSRLMEQILSRASRLDLDIWPEVVPLSILRARGTLTTSEAVAHFLCCSPDGPKLRPSQAAKAMGAGDRTSVRNWVRAAQRKRGESKKVPLKQGQKPHRIPGQDRERRGGPR